MSSNTCAACGRAETVIPGGKCPLHESSTSPIVHRIAQTYGHPGPLGEPCRQLMGYEPNRASRAWRMTPW